MKKFLVVLLVIALCAAPMSVMAYTAFGDAYPASQKEFGIAAPSDGALMIGEVIGGEESLLGGWSGDGERNPDTAAHAAFTGLTDRGEPGAFFDPMFANDPVDYCGLKMAEPYVLTEIRLLPRDDQLGRHAGAAIWGYNGGTFDPATATLIFESDEGALDFEFQIYKTNDFIAGSNVGFTHFVYYNEQQHGDIMEIELYGNPLNPPAAPEPEPAAVEAAPVAASAPAPVAASPVAPSTGDMGIVIALAIFVATAFVTIKMTKEKNRA